MLDTFQKDKKNRGSETIVSAVVEKYDNVKVEKGKDDLSYATVIVAIHSKNKGKSSTSFESFICRTDSNKKWKILGWKAASQQEAMDAEVIGLTSVMLGAGRETKEADIDYSAGIVLGKKVGEAVCEGDTLCTFYTARNEALKAAEERFLSSLTFGDEKPQEAPLIYEVVR